MGFKSKLSKMKSFLFDEEEDEKELKKTKKNVIEPDKKMEKEDHNVFSHTQEIEELSFEDDITSFKEPVDLKSRSEKKDNDFKFPEFDDEDFIVSKSMPEEIKPIVKEEPKRVLYQGSKRKEETKRFKPSPIISPIYGLLDKDGNTISKEEKEQKSLSQDVSFENVRRKAYGSFNEELENTLKRLSKKTIEEAERDMEEEEKYEQTAPIKVLEDEVVIEKEEDDDMILPNINFKEIDVDKERTKNEKKEEIIKKQVEETDDDDEDTKEQDLFNLIDSMYQKGDE